MRKYYILLLFLCFFLSACTSPKISPLQPHEIIEINGESDTKSYLIGVGDKLSIKFFFNNTLNDEVVVRPDGKISLQLVEEVQAAGLTPDKLDAVLTEKYAEAFKTSSNNYVLAVNDQIAIKSYYHEKLNDTVTVRPDGKISLLLVDEVQAAGYSPAELDVLLSEKYSAFFESPDLSVNVLSFNRPDLTVIVKEFSDQQIYIGGEVTKPGIVKIKGRLRILDAIIQAAGALDSGDLSQVILIRLCPTNEPEIHSVNVQDVLRGQSPDIWLKPYDIVYVPKTSIANVEQFVRTYLWDLLPDQVAFSFLYQWNNEVQVK